MLAMNRLYKWLTKNALYYYKSYMANFFVVDRVYSKYKLPLIYLSIIM